MIYRRSHYGEFRKRRSPALLPTVVACCLLITVANAFAENRCAPDALILRFDPGMISFPQEIDFGQNSFIVPLEDAEFTLPAHASLLSQLGAMEFETVGAHWRHLAEEDSYDRHGNRIDLVDFTDVYRVTFQVGQGFSIEDVLETLQGVTGLSYVECDEIGELFFTPNDSLYTDQWNLNNTGQTWPADSCDSLYDINAPEAWDIWDSAGTKIGICDGGLDGTHEDLEDFIDRDLSKSFIKGVNWSGPGHGTQVAGVAAAGTDNDSIGIAGVANLSPNHEDSLIVALRVFEGTLGDTAAAVDARVSDAFSYVTGASVYPQVLVINNSWGTGTHYKNCYSYGATLRDAFRNAFNKDISLVCAAGNGANCSEDPCEPTESDTCFAYPAAYEDYGTCQRF